MGIKSARVRRAWPRLRVVGRNSWKENKEGEHRCKAICSLVGGKEFLSDGFYFVTNRTEVRSPGRVCGEGGMLEG